MIRNILEGIIESRNVSNLLAKRYYKLIDAHKNNRKLIKYYITNKIYYKHNCQLSPNSIVGKGVKFPHPIGIVIGSGTQIGENVTIFQQVTFGSHGNPKKEKLYPTIENDVIIYAGAKIIGGITIGKNSVIGANSLVNINVPENSIAYGIPLQVNKKNE